MARYNYIFRHDDPRRRRGSKTQRRRASTQPRRAGSNVRSVYVPETGETYPSIAAAARELGVDSGNISKVLSGKRKTAGGFHFIRGERPEKWGGAGGSGAWPEPGEPDIDYGGGGGSPAPAPEPEEPEAPDIDYGGSDPADALRDLIKQKIDEINRMIEEARARKREGFLDDLNDLHDFAADILGETGDNLIDDQSDVLDDMDLDELNQLNKTLSEKIDKAREDVKNAEDRIAGYADVFGVSSHEMEKYEDLIPEINRTLDRAAKISGTNLWYAIKDAIARGVDPEDLRDLLQKVNDYFDNPDRSRELKEILKEWEDSVYHGDSDDEDDDTDF